MTGVGCRAPAAWMTPCRPPKRLRVSSHGAGDLGSVGDVGLHDEDIGAAGTQREDPGEGAADLVVASGPLGPGLLRGRLPVRGEREARATQVEERAREQETERRRCLP